MLLSNEVSAAETKSVSFCLIHSYPFLIPFTAAFMFPQGGDDANQWPGKFF